MKHLLKLHTISFKNAFSGFFWAIKSQPNYKIHFILSFIAMVLGFYLNISYLEWLVIILLIIIGLLIETVNTAFEVTTDCIDTRWREDIKIAKDVSAASMLVFSIGASILAVVIFIPKILIILNF